jgi:hypothetical protein
MILVDAHVHIYDCFDLQTFLNSAFANFKNHASGGAVDNGFTALLLLTEGASENWFRRLQGFAREGKVIGDTASSKWSFHITDENHSLQAHCNDTIRLFLIAGRQIVTAERMEVLALLTDRQFADGSPLEDVVQTVSQAGALPVIPYGFGKWMGTRGKILKSFLEKPTGQPFFLGDNGGRPRFLPRPSHFSQGEKNGTRVLPGSDPLPFPSQCKRAGGFGFAVNGAISLQHPAEDLKRILLDPQLTFRTYGQLEIFHHFITNQLTMQLNKRKRN